MEPSALAESVRAQLAALDGAARAAGMRIEAVKPHGALYHDVARDERLAEALIEAIARALGPSGAAIVGPPGGALRGRAGARGWGYLREGFADRAYGPDGKLVPRSRPDALITDPAAARAQALRLADGGEFDTLCVHGDTEGAVGIARAVRAGLLAAGLLLEHT